jgi:hypothetical protein
MNWLELGCRRDTVVIFTGASDAVTFISCVAEIEPAKTSPNAIVAGERFKTPRGTGSDCASAGDAEQREQARARRTILRATSIVQR